MSSKPFARYVSNTYFGIAFILTLITLHHVLAEVLPPWSASLVQLGNEWDQVVNQFASKCDIPLSLEQTLFPTLPNPSSSSSSSSPSSSTTNQIDNVSRLSLKELELYIKRKQTQYFAVSVESIFYSSILKLADDAYQLESNLNETIKAFRNKSYSAKLYPAMKLLGVQTVTNVTEHADAFMSEYARNSERYSPVIKAEERAHLLNLLSTQSIVEVFKEKVRKNFHREISFGARYALDLFKDKSLSDGLQHLSRAHVVGHQLIDQIFSIAPSSLILSNDATLEETFNIAREEGSSELNALMRDMILEAIEDEFDMRVIQFAFQRMFNEKLVASNPTQWRSWSPPPASSLLNSQDGGEETATGSTSIDNNNFTSSNHNIDERKLKQFVRFLSYLKLTFRSGLQGAVEAIQRINKPTEQLIDLINDRVEQVTRESYTDLVQLNGSN